MNIKNLMDYIQMGREIEFSLNESGYFISPTYEEKDIQQQKYTEYLIYDCKRKEIIYTGSIDQLLAYKFNNKYSLKNNFEMFNIDYVF